MKHTGKAHIPGRPFVFYYGKDFGFTMSNENPLKSFKQRSNMICLILKGTLLLLYEVHWGRGRWRY